VIQVALQWLMFSIIIILFLLYFPPPRIPPPSPTDPGRLHDEEHHIHIPTPAELIHSEYTPPTYRTAVSVTVANAVWFIAGAIVSIVFLARSTHQARIWAAWLGVLSMVLAAAQYIPQLWVTWRIKVPSPLSILLPKVCVADIA
jgi:hypothetical protein